MTQQSEVIFNLKDEINKYSVSKDNFNSKISEINSENKNRNELISNIQIELSNLKSEIENKLNTTILNDNNNVALDLIKITEDQNNILKGLYNTTDGGMSEMMTFDDLYNHLLNHNNIDLKGNMGLNEPTITGKQGKFFVCPVLLCDNTKFELKDWKANCAINGVIYSSRILSNGLGFNDTNFGTRISLNPGSYIVHAQTLFPEKHNYTKTTCFKRIIVE